MFKNTVLLFLLIQTTSFFSQKNDSAFYVFKQAEKELMEIHKIAFYSKLDAERVKANKEALAVWDRIVNNPSIIEYPFDSLKKDISILVPRDKKFKLISWNLHRDDGTHAYFGYLLVNNSKRIKKGFLQYETTESFENFKLIDRSMTIKSPENHIGTTDKWFGMLYTEVIDCDEFYTLIGWDGNDKITQRKFVDVLYFKSDGTPVFGKDVFKLPKKNPKRLMFEYSSEVSMSLKYNRKLNQIVYSHLASKQEGILLDGQFQYYGPDGSFDALELKKDKWVTVEDVDARNDKTKNDNAEKPDPKKQTPVFKPR